MAVSDPVANMLTKIRNANMVKFDRVDVSISKLKLEIIKILKNEGFIKNYRKIVIDGKSYIRLFLKYDDDRKPIIHGLKMISTPGRRIYSGYRSIPQVINGFGTVIISTSLGIITGKKAKEKKVGGELICTVW